MDFDNQLLTLESALGVATPWKGPVREPVTLPMCASDSLPSLMTRREYDNANRLNKEKTILTLNNNRILFRLLMIQKAAMDKYNAEKYTTPCPTRRPRGPTKIPKIVST